MIGTGKTWEENHKTRNGPVRDKLMDQKKQMTQKYEQFAVYEEIEDASIVYNEITALVEATHKYIKVLIDLHEPYTEIDATNEVSEDTFETLSKLRKN